MSKDNDDDDDIQWATTDDEWEPLELDHIPFVDIKIHTDIHKYYDQQWASFNGFVMTLEAKRYGVHDYQCSHVLKSQNPMKWNIIRLTNWIKVSCADHHIKFMARIIDSKDYSTLKYLTPLQGHQHLATEYKQLPLPLVKVKNHKETEVVIEIQYKLPDIDSNSSSSSSSSSLLSSVKDHSSAVTSDPQQQWNSIRNVREIIEYEKNSNTIVNFHTKVFVVINSWPVCRYVHGHLNCSTGVIHIDRQKSYYETFLARTKDGKWFHSSLKCPDRYTIQSETDSLSSRQEWTFIEYKIT